MKKRKFLLPVVALSLLCSFGLAACGGGEGGDQSGSSAQSSAQERQLKTSRAFRQVQQTRPKPLHHLLRYALELLLIAETIHA